MKILTKTSSLQARTPKASINLDTLNAVFVPEKTGNPCALQLMFDENGSTRNVFVYANDPKVSFEASLLKHVI